MPAAMHLRRLATGLAPVIVLIVHFWVKARIIRLRPIPLSTDPCDAVNIAAFTVFLISGISAVFLLIRRPASETRTIHLWRASEAVVLAAFFTVGAEVIAMLRNLSLLLPQQRTLFSLLILETLVVIAAQALLIWIRRADRRIPRLAVALAVFVPLFILAVIPEWTVDGNTLLLHMLTVVVGFIVLFTPVHTLLMLLSEGHPGLRSGMEKIAFALGALLVLAGFWELDRAAQTRGAIFLLVFAGCLTLAFSALARPLGIVPSSDSNLA